MKFVKQSAREAPRMSIVLIDWSVRESFHILHYLARQAVPHSFFEVIVIEYYDRRSTAVAAHEDQVDGWVLLEMPRSCYYHKHLMYNVGIALAKGEIVLIGDSDAMVRESFVQSILDRFVEDPGIVLHLDQFRNNRRDLYPFCYPSFEDVTGPGCINNAGGKTAGIVDRHDPLHSRNYGACMCARRADLIAIGGADEHIDYLGHICGPYEMTFRLFNYGLKEVWHEREFMYHTWHPGAYGVDNYLGPHDGRHMSSTAVEALSSGRVAPLAENRAIRALRQRESLNEAGLRARLIDPAAARDWQADTIGQVSREARWRLARYAATPSHYRGFRIEAASPGYAAMPILGDRASGADGGLAAPSVDALLEAIDRRAARADRATRLLAGTFVFSDRVMRKLGGKRRDAT